MVNNKKQLPTQEFLMHLLYKLKIKHQQKLQKMQQVFHMLMLLELITQVPHPWIQMHQFGKELLFMMVRFMVKSNIKRMQMISKLMEKSKKHLPIQDCLTLQLHKSQHQQALPKMPMDFHMLMLKETTIQEQHQWIQMLQFGREKKSMMVKYMERKSTSKMPLISNLMEINKKQLQTQDYHITQLLKKHNQIK
jgi:hypothetical protein